MSTSTRQSNLFAAEDWRKLYTTFRSADFQSYDYETLRKSMVDYLRTYYPEDFNDYIESSEFIALLDLISFMGQSISYRSDLNFRENFLQTAERRDSIYRMASMLGYSPNRNNPASGVLKIVSLNTSEDIIDSNGVNIGNRTIRWNDPSNPDWFEQFTAIINRAIQVDQRIGKPSGSLRIGNVRHDLYEFRTRPNQVPIINFNSTVNSTSMAFNIYNAGLDNVKGLIEKAPEPGQSFGFLYKTDGEGNASANTGFFVAFKQGRLNNLDFTIGESLPNRLVSLNVNNINNSDTWLFEINDAGAYLDQWTKVDILRDSNVIYNNINQNTRKVFSVYSRANDQVDLVFGDGVFSEIPVGLLRAVVRVSNGLSYTITPQEMRNINVELPYVNKAGKVERLRMTVSLQYTVSNASTRESLSEIKVKAPQNFYTQNRMINGEDYNTLPFVKYGDILKVKAVNRTSSGISRFLDLRDVTGKYSSTNIFCDDGYVYKEEDALSSEFNWTTAADVQNFVTNTLSGILRSKESINLYYYGFETKIPSTTYWIKGTANSSTSTGFFVLDPNITPYDVQQIGTFTANNRKFIEPGALLLFRAPAGFFFDTDRVLTAGTPTQQGQVTEIWASVKSVVDDGTSLGNGWLNGQSEGEGPVVLTENIPSGAQLVEIYPVYNTTLGITFSQSVSRKIINNEDFGLRYDVETREWTIVNPDDINTGTFSVSNAGDSSGAALDASWQVLMINNGLGRYSVFQRRLNFFFGSEIETRFFFDSRTRVYDSRNGTVIKDQVNILKGNTLPDSDSFLPSELSFEIYDTVNYTDGYSDDSRVKITYADRDNDGVPDNPRVFDILVDENTNVLQKLVFFEKYLDYDNFERYRYFETDNVVTRYATLTTINSEGRYAHPVGTVFYAYNEATFYQLTLVEGVRTISATTDYIVRVGRDNINFQYRHNSPNDRRIDPSASNIIDMYVLTESYNQAYRVWLSDTTGNIAEPDKPTNIEMRIAYQELEELKSVSDNLSYNPAEFKILFGDKAPQELQATFKVVRAENTRLSNSEIRTNVIKAINEYFAIENWDFGDTFYFSELAAYIHQELNPDIGSVVIVPKTSTQSFGDLFQITCNPNEIFVSAATVDNVEIIDSVTANELQRSQIQGASASASIFGGYTPNSLRNLS
jgi:hypothetical protein